MFKSSIRLLNITTQDSGTYSCAPKSNLRLEVVAQDATRVDQNQINEFTPPSFRRNKTPGLVVKHENSGVRLRCPADGNPKPEVRWSKDGKALENAAPDAYRTGPWGIAIDTLEIKKHAGIYICSASNSAGSINSSIELVITGQFHTLRHFSHCSGIVLN